MRTPTRTRTAALLVPVVLALAGCGDDEGVDAASAGSSADSAEPTTSAPENEPTKPNDGQSEPDDDEPQPDDGEGDTGADVELEIEIEQGSVTPAGEQVEANVGDTVALVVDSDAAEELHVHSSPEHEFVVKAADDQVFRFPVEQPGQVAIEAHESGVLVAELVVSP